MSKKVIRIISFILVVVTLLGFIIPYVSATEINDKDGEDVVGTDNIVGETPESLYGTPPEGFELIIESDYYRVKKNNTDINVWFQIPITEETPRLQVTAFVVDIDKNMIVEQVVLSADETYVGGLKLNDGYYALITGNYAFGNDGSQYEINAGDILYFYIGDGAALDQAKYGVPFHVVDDKAITLSLDAAREGTVLATNTISNSDVAIPEEITKMTSGDIVEIEPDQNDQTTQPIDPGPEPEEPEKKEKEFVLIRLVKNSWLWLVLLGITAIAYKIFDNKKKDKFEKRIESDRNDKGRFE